VPSVVDVGEVDDVLEYKGEIAWVLAGVTCPVRTIDQGMERDTVVGTKGRKLRWRRLLDVTSSLPPRCVSNVIAACRFPLLQILEKIGSQRCYEQSLEAAEQARVDGRGTRPQSSIDKKQMSKVEGAFGSPRTRIV
jgi:hypothetical protein